MKIFTIIAMLFLHCSYGIDTFTQGVIPHNKKFTIVSKNGVDRYYNYLTQSYFTNQSPLKISFHNEFDEDFPIWLKKFEKEYQISCISRLVTNNFYKCQRSDTTVNILSLIEEIEKVSNVIQVEPLMTRVFQVR